MRKKNYFGHSKRHINFVNESSTTVLFRNFVNTGHGHDPPVQSLERKKQITRLGFRNSSTPVFKSLGKKITLGQGKWQVIEHVFRFIERKKQMMRLKLGNSATPVFRPLLKKIICKSTYTAKVASNRAVSNRASFLVE